METEVADIVLIFVGVFGIVVGTIIGWEVLKTVMRNERKD